MVEETTRKNRPLVSLLCPLKGVVVKLDLFLAIFFFIIGITGLVFQNNAGVFAGLSLFPWQMIKLMKGKLHSFIIIIISGITGTIFFVLKKEWPLVLLFLFIQLYNYWGYLNIKKKRDN